MAPCLENEVPGGNRDILKFFQKTKSRFEDVCREEVKELRSVKIQFGLLVSFYIKRSSEWSIILTACSQ